MFADDTKLMRPVWVITLPQPSYYFITGIHRQAETTKGVTCALMKR
jgi:hypothetical protein